MLAIGPVLHPISGAFKLEGIALGTIVVLAGYHMLRAIATRVSGPEVSYGEIGFEKDAGGRTVTRRG
jgi:hypothetical protein